MAKEAIDEVADHRSVNCHQDSARARGIIGLAVLVLLVSAATTACGAKTAATRSGGAALASSKISLLHIEKTGLLPIASLGQQVDVASNNASQIMEQLTAAHTRAASEIGSSEASANATCEKDGFGSTACLNAIDHEGSGVNVASEAPSTADDAGVLKDYVTIDVDMTAISTDLTLAAKSASRISFPAKAKSDSLTLRSDLKSTAATAATVALEAADHNTAATAIVILDYKSDAESTAAALVALHHLLALPYPTLSWEQG